MIGPQILLGLVLVILLILLVVQVYWKVKG